MKCPNCEKQLATIEYEGIRVESCPGCGGEWLDSDELGKVVRLREVKFNEEERRAIAESTTVTGVALDTVDRDLTCPKCGGKTDAINYATDTGIILDRCPSCGGFWLDREELEKVQKLVEGWEDKLPEDLQKYGPMLRDIEQRMKKDPTQGPSALPVVGGFINVLINGIVDLAFEGR